jgi:uncharacterized protein (DUF2141 family)
MQTLCSIALASLVITSSACAARSPAASAPPPAEARSPGTGRVEVRIDGFDNEEGQVLIALFLDDAGWPNDETRAFAASVLPIRDLQAVTEFEEVPAGPFAISVFHDEDLDRELDTGIFGIPTEAYGFSRDARDTFGPPGFDEARLDVTAGESLRITIRVD